MFWKGTNPRRLFESCSYFNTGAYLPQSLWNPEIIGLYQQTRTQRAPRHHANVNVFITFWRHDVCLTSWQTFWHHDKLLTSWRVFDVMTNCWRHDVFLTSWWTFDVMYFWRWRTVWRHDVFLTSLIFSKFMLNTSWWGLCDIRHSLNTCSYCGLCSPIWHYCNPWLVRQDCCIVYYLYHNVVHWQSNNGMLQHQGPASCIW